MHVHTVTHTETSTVYVQAARGWEETSWNLAENAVQNKLVLECQKYKKKSC